jgi:hypothetical protein
MDKLELLDIIAPLAPPPAPPHYGWIALGVIWALLIVGGLLYLGWRRGRERRVALAQLKRTAQALRHQQVDPRTAAFRTGLALRHVFRTPPSQSSGDWAHFLRALDQARFGPQVPTTHTSAQLLERARHFLRARC